MADLLDSRAFGAAALARAAAAVNSTRIGRAALRRALAGGTLDVREVLQRFGSRGTFVEPRDPARRSAVDAAVDAWFSWRSRNATAPTFALYAAIALGREADRLAREKISRVRRANIARKC